MNSKFKIIFSLFFLIYFQILYSSNIFLSKRSGEYYDNFGRKLTIDNFGYGIFEEKGIKSESFKIGQPRSVETTYTEYIKIILDNAASPTTAEIEYHLKFYCPAYAANPGYSDTVIARYEGTINKFTSSGS